ncbi:MAG TPA: hypothetical protein DDW52_13575 [Planctomycetaceae bacterium]|nr:hypothetical protein [Planctomycetaceae bacterium]
MPLKEPAAGTFVAHEELSESSQETRHPFFFLGLVVLSTTTDQPHSLTTEVPQAQQMSKLRASAYAEVAPESLTIRDHLARDRTILANERTLLAYVRTGFGFAAAGLTLVKLFPEEPSSQILGFSLLALSIVICLIGVIRFITVRKQLAQITQ